MSLVAAARRAARNVVADMLAIFTFGIILMFLWLGRSR